MPDLTVNALSKRFGGIIALDVVSFEVDEGEIVGLIGPNGAGKTTLFNCVSRFYDPDSGSVHFKGVEVTRLAPEGVIRAGIARTFQQAHLFRSMTVLENVETGRHSLGTGFRFPWQIRADARDTGRAAQEIIEYLGLRDVRDYPAASLPFGLQKRVELARALAASPRLLLLDEPASGLSHEEMDAWTALIRNLQDDLHLTILLVEHNMSLVMGLSNRVVVLDFGRKIAEGTPQEVQQNPAVIEAYLGASGA